MFFQTNIFQISLLMVIYIYHMFQNIFRLAPGFCFADGLASLALRRQDLTSGTGTLDWNITGASICYLGIEVLV